MLEMDFGSDFTFSHPFVVYTAKRGVAFPHIFLLTGVIRKCKLSRETGRAKAFGGELAMAVVWAVEFAASE